MTDFPDTRESLLVQVKDPGNALAWREFTQSYRPVIYRIALSKGMQEADAQDLAQQVLLSVASAVGHWERDEKGTPFRHWLARVTRNAVLKALSRGAKHQTVGALSSDDVLQQLSNPDEETSQLIEVEYRRQLYLRAATTVKADVSLETWLAFEMTTLEGVSIEAAAKTLGKHSGAIYAARSRVMRRLREVVSLLEKEENGS